MNKAVLTLLQAIVKMINDFIKQHDTKQPVVKTTTKKPVVKTTIEKLEDDTKEFDNLPCIITLKRTGEQTQKKIKNARTILKQMYSSKDDNAIEKMIHELVKNKKLDGSYKSFEIGTLK